MAGLTNRHSVFAALSETGMNKLMYKVSVSRPSHFVFGTPRFVPVGSTSGTSVPNIPGYPLLDFMITLLPPIVDFFPQTPLIISLPNPNPAPNPPLILGQNHFLTMLNVTINFSGFPFPPVQVYAFGTSVLNGPHLNQFITFVVDRAYCTDPGLVGTLINTSGAGILTTFLSNFPIRVPQMSLGAFSLALADGPLIENNQVEVWGDIL